jgi:tungstate transport system permease protein
MSEVADGFQKAIKLIFSLDPEIWRIALRSLSISSISTVISSLICIPIGGFIFFFNFRLKRLLISIIQTLFSLPTVCVGLFVFLILSKTGPLGFLGFLFTPTGIVMGQSILISPIITGLTISALSGVRREIKETAVSLGATNLQAVLVIMRESRYALMAAVIMGFGRAISEVGIAMMIGGNIRDYTRVLTTAIALETSMGNVEISIALGIILMICALVVNLILGRIQQK